MITYLRGQSKITEIVGVIAQISALTFILTSMLAMGLSLTLQQIIDPLKDIRRVLLALLANFISGLVQEIS